MPRPQAVSESLEEHPATRAWLRVAPGSAIPTRIEQFGRAGRTKKKRKSAVFRLHGVGPGGTVIAKSCKRHKLERELFIYERFLSRLPLSSLRILGASTSDGDDDRPWLFVEDGGDFPFSRQNEAHRRVAARWLARLHVGAAALLDDVELPPTGPGFYRLLLEESQALAAEASVRADLAPEQLAALEEMNRVAELVGSRWRELELFCDRMPQTLVHGDFIDKNVKVGPERDGELPLFVFDWETAGLGCPAVDLATSNWGAHDDGLGEYFAIARQQWPDLVESDLRSMLEVGRVFRNIASIRWSCESLRFSRMERPFARISSCVEGLRAGIIPIS